MCSIFGYYKIKDNKIHRDFVSQSFNLMRHRGPDNENFIEVDEKVGLGHQRLAIIDTLKEANQPMYRNSVFIVFNGQIYNYIELKKELEDNNIIFETKSDTEVLLKGLEFMGIKFLNKCNGMFAFALYNKVTKELILARDRFGVKPLHYTIEDGVLYFSSEIKPLAKIKNKLERNIKIYDSFIKDTATDFDEDTFLKDIYQLKKGSYLICGTGNIKKNDWYFGDDFKFDLKIFKDDNATLDFAETLLSDAIDKRLRADVPVCITLSGGLDSTTIYTLCRERLKKDIKAFTFSHPGSGIDEYGKVNKLTASYNDTFHCVKSEYEQGYKEVEEALYYLEFPIWNISGIAYMNIYKAVRDKGFVVVLEGHGSDEQLGGYPYMIRSAVFEYIRNINFKDAAKIYKVLNETNNPYLYQKNSLLLLGSYFIKNVIFKRKLDVSFAKTIKEAFDYKVLPRILRTFDRLTMKNSVESRSPFMDYRIVEFFSKMPLRYKVSELGSKAILRQILRKYNKEFLYKNKAKIGFACDLHAFFEVKENKEYMRGKIVKFNLKRYNWLKKKALQNIAKDNLSWIATEPICKIASLSIMEEFYGI